MQPTHFMQEHIVGKIDSLQDIIMLRLSSRAAQAAVAHLDWTGVHTLRWVALPMVQGQS